MILDRQAVNERDRLSDDNHVVNVEPYAKQPTIAGEYQVSRGGVPCHLPAFEHQLALTGPHRLCDDVRIVPVLDAVYVVGEQHPLSAWQELGKLNVIVVCQVCKRLHPPTVRQHTEEIELPFAAKHNASIRSPCPAESPLHIRQDGRCAAC